MKTASAATAVETVVFVFAWEAIFGPDRSLPYFEEAARQALLRVINELETTGLATHNIELFMAACDRTDHDRAVTDAMTQQGWWHGLI